VARIGGRSATVSSFVDAIAIGNDDIAKVLDEMARDRHRLVDVHNGEVVVWPDPPSTHR